MFQFFYGYASVAKPYKVFITAEKPWWEKKKTLFS